MSTRLELFKQMRSALYDLYLPISLYIWEFTCLLVKEMRAKLIDVRSDVMDCVVHVTGLKLTLISLLFQSIERK